MWCIDPWYCFGGRSTSAGKFGQENFFTSILMVKNAIFLLFRKYGLIVQDGQYRLSGGFPGSKGQISGQISYFRPLWNKISIFEKSHFWRFFDDFLDFANLIRGRDRPEVAGPMKYYQKCVLGTLQKCFHTYNINITPLDRILKQFEICSIFAISSNLHFMSIFAHKMQIAQNC